MLWLDTKSGLRTYGRIHRRREGKICVLLRSCAGDEKRKGIAKLLLKYVCQDAAQKDFDYVEAYPDKKYTNECEGYMGPLDLYNQHGFIVYSETADKFIMRKQLKGEPGAENVN